MISVKTPDEVKIMAEGGVISGAALKEVIKHIKPGVSLAQLDKVAENFILQNKGQASFKTVDDYKYTTCININAGIVHGIPNGYIVKQGDIVSIDLGVLYKGFHTDISYTVEVNTINETKFLAVGKTALEAGISQCLIDNRLYDISSAIQTVVEKAGYSVSRDLVGHGVGKSLHEDPYVPGYGKAGRGPLLKDGMVFAIEVIYQKGNPAIVLDKDGWTLKTADNSLSGLFEHTVAITAEGPKILTVI